MVSTGGRFTCRSITCGATRFASIRCTRMPSAATEQRLGHAGHTEGKEGGQDRGDERAEEGHDGRHAGEDAEGRKSGHAEDPEPERREQAEDEHGGDLPDHPRAERGAEIGQDAERERAPRRRPRATTPLV